MMADPTAAPGEVSQIAMKHFIRTFPANHLLTLIEQNENINFLQIRLDGCHAMSATPELDSQSEMQRLDAAADAAIAACDGNLRSTIRSLILANEFLEYEIAELFTAVSKAYVNGKRRGRSEARQPPANRRDWYD